MSALLGGRIPTKRLAWMATLRDFFQQHLEPRAFSARPVLPTRNPGRSITCAHLSGKKRITSFLGHQSRLRTHGSRP